MISLVEYLKIFSSKSETIYIYIYVYVVFTSLNKRDFETNNKKMMLKDTLLKRSD
jgi:hypothetical protein